MASASARAISFRKLPLDASQGDVLTSFIAQYYLDKPVPRELSSNMRPTRRCCWPRRWAHRPGTRWRSSAACAAIARAFSNSRRRTPMPRWPRASPATKRSASASRHCAICSSSTSCRSASGVLRHQSHDGRGDRGLVRVSRRRRAGEIAVSALQHRRHRAGRRLRRDAPGAGTALPARRRRARACCRIFC